MSAAQRAALPTYGELTIGEVLELVLESRDSSLEHKLLAATLEALATWLAEQSRALARGDEDASSSSLLSGRTALAGAVLTCREREVALRIARGLSNREIARDLVIALGTTERHVANILNKLGVRSRSQIAAWAVEHGLL